MMNTMNMPAFTAEATLSNSHFNYGRRAITHVGKAPSGLVGMAQIEDPIIDPIVEAICFSCLRYATDPRDCDFYCLAIPTIQV